MNKDKKLVIGLFGFGVVGEGIYNVLNNTPSLISEVKKVCIKHQNKSRNAPNELFTTDSKLLLEDPSINVIVELIDNAEEAYLIVKTALKNKKNVVSANKKLIATHYEELLQLSQENGVSFLYEAAVCGSIPIIRNLEEYYDNDWLYGFSGIINGCTNYILTQMRNEKIKFTDALLQAQINGFAESDPSLDIKGIDAANKLSILLAHIYGQHWSPDNILCKGIQSLDIKDFEYAQEKRLDIKLVAHIICDQNNVTPVILPTFVDDQSLLYHLDNEYNGVVLKSVLSDEQFLYGKGAGRYPTSSAVLSDLSALRYGYKYEYRKQKLQINYSLSFQGLAKIYVSYPIGTEIPQNIFERVDTIYKSLHRNYLIGHISLEKLLESELLLREDCSIIYFNDTISNDASIKESYLTQASSSTTNSSAI